MKTKKPLTLILLVVTAFSLLAQTTFNTENVEDFFNEEIKSLDSFNLPVKSTNEDVFVLDSIIQARYDGDDTVFSKTTIKYNSKGQAIETIISYQNALGNYYPRYRHEYILDDNGTHFFYIYYQWNSTLMQWIEDSKDEYIFYPDGKLKEENSYRYDSSIMDWRNSMKKEISYDENGKFRHDTTSVWTVSKNSWQFYMNYESEQDEDGNAIWSVSSVYDSYFDWTTLNKFEYTYKNGKRALVQSYTWWSTLNQWKIWQIDEYSYNEAGSEILFLNKQWNSTDSVWVFSYKKENEYNSANQLISETSYNLDVDSNLWIPSIKISYEYNNNGNKKIENSYEWNIGLDDWQLIIRKKYFYSEFTTNINDDLPELQSVKVYPIPANESFTIETQNPEITFGKLYDLNGKLVKNLIVQQGINTYNISELKSGVYFIQVPQKEGLVVRKLVKN